MRVCEGCVFVPDVSCGLVEAVGAWNDVSRLLVKVRAGEEGWVKGTVGGGGGR